MSPQKTSNKVAAPENLLFLSHIEICRILRVLAKEHSPIRAEISETRVFKSHLHSVNERGGFFTVGFGNNKATNSQLLALPAVNFTATGHQDTQFSFEGRAPEARQIGGEPLIQLQLPEKLLLHNRREHPHVPVQLPVSLRCISNALGVTPFEAHITDISHDGLGCLIYEHRVNLKIGSVLKGNRIVLPDGASVLADLELRNIITTTLDDGKLIHRAGFRFVLKKEELARMVKLFIQDLGKTTLSQ